MFLSLFISFMHRSFIGKREQLVKKSCLGIGKAMCWLSLCPWLFDIVVWMLGANCLYDTPTWVFNKHFKLHFLKAELLVTPQPTETLLSHLPGCSRKAPRVILNSSLSLSPQPICQQFYWYCFKNVSLNVWPLHIAAVTSLSSHHHSFSGLLPRSSGPSPCSLVICVLPSSKNHPLKAAHPRVKSFPCLKSWAGFPQ